MVAGATAQAGPPENTSTAAAKKLGTVAFNSAAANSNTNVRKKRLRNVLSPQGRTVLNKRNAE